MGGEVGGGRRVVTSSTLHLTAACGCVGTESGAACAHRAHGRARHAQCVADARRAEVEWCWGAVVPCVGCGSRRGGVSERREALRNRSNSELLNEVTLRSGEIGALCVCFRKGFWWDGWCCRCLGRPLASIGQDLCAKLGAHRLKYEKLSR